MLRYWTGYNRALDIGFYYVIKRNIHRPYVTPRSKNMSEEEFELRHKMQEYMEKQNAKSPI